MIIVGEKAYLKEYDPKLNNDNLSRQIEIHNAKNIEKQEIKATKVNRKESKTSNNNIYKNIKDKAQILRQDQRDIQDKISAIQIQEQKVSEMENTLKQVRKSYEQAIKEGKQEEAKQKIKIKTVEKEVDNLNKEKKEYVQDDKKILNTVDNALKKINDIKSKLAQYKNKLISLESNVNKNKEEAKHQENIIENYMHSEESINEKMFINPTDFVFIEGDMNIGITINILP